MWKQLTEIPAPSKIGTKHIYTNGVHIGLDYHPSATHYLYVPWPIPRNCAQCVYYTDLVCSPPIIFTPWMDKKRLMHSDTIDMANRCPHFTAKGV